MPSHPHSLSVVQTMHIRWAGKEDQGRWEEVPLAVGAGSGLGTDAGSMKLLGCPDRHDKG